MIALFIRIIASIMYRGHETDMNCFTGWSSMIFEDGFSAFYTSDTFHDYPPGYMYVLYVIGAIKSFIKPTDGISWFLIKSPAIVCDILCAILTYKIALKTRFAKITGAIISALYLFNPTTIINSSFWGQVDSVYTFFILLMIYMLSNKQLIKSYFVFALCIFIKPQAFMFFPLILFGIIENAFLNGFNKKLFIKSLAYGLCAILMIFILSMPFGIKNVYEQYVSTLSSYPYLTVNAFNIWGALGLNWASITPVMSVVTYMILALIVLYCGYVFFKTKKQSKYYYVGALLSFLTFMLSTKMHDRYAYTSMILMLVAFIYYKDLKSYIIYTAFTVSQFFNTAWVLFIYNQDINKFYRSITVNIASVVNIILLVAVIIYTNRYYCKNKEFNTVITKNKKIKLNNIKFTKSSDFRCLGKVDYIIIISVMIIYSLIAFYNLGDTSSPQTGTKITADAVTIDLGKEENIAEIKMFLGHNNIDENNTIEITYLNKNKTVTDTQIIDSGSVFKWNEIPTQKTAQYITLYA
ncbi:MAG: hypothetical protein IKV64_02555, partial [Clostridia bacterium]|nr:hypothetical protein [Clostridia bacterium]